jgi:hypothetical protein
MLSALPDVDAKRSRPSIGKPAKCHASKERVLLIGTDQRITSGPAARTAAFRGRIHGCTRTIRETSDSFPLYRGRRPYMALLCRRRCLLECRLLGDKRKSSQSEGRCRSSAAQPAKDAAAHDHPRHRLGDDRDTQSRGVLRVRFGRSGGLRAPASIVGALRQMICCA